MYRTVSCLFVVVCLPVVFAGCLAGPTVWTPTATVEMKIDAAGLTRLEAQTYNGAIKYDGADATQDAVNVVITKKGGGLTLAEAEEALAAIDVYVEDIGGGGKRLAWRWSKPRGIRWSGEVAFEMKGPAKLAFSAETHNGRINVAGLRADTKLETYNGRIEVEAECDALRAETHNGAIVAKYSGSQITLVTYNGGISADLSGAKNIGGEITSHNGGIKIDVGKTASLDLECDTHNGSIDFEMPIMLQKSSRGHVTARLGNGGPRLDVETYNGNIKIRNAG